MPRSKQLLALIQRVAVDLLSLHSLPLLLKQLGQDAQGLHRLRMRTAQQLLMTSQNPFEKFLGLQELTLTLQQKTQIPHETKCLLSEAQFPCITRSFAKHFLRLRGRCGLCGQSQKVHGTEAPWMLLAQLFLATGKQVPQQGFCLCSMTPA